MIVYVTRVGFFGLFHPRLSTEQTPNPLNELRQSSSPARQVRHAVPGPSPPPPFFLTEHAYFGITPSGRAHRTQPSSHTPSFRAAAAHHHAPPAAGPAGQRQPRAAPSTAGRRSRARFWINSSQPRHRDRTPSERTGSGEQSRPPFLQPPSSSREQPSALTPRRRDAAACSPAGRPPSRCRLRLRLPGRPLPAEAGSRRAHVTPAGGAQRVTRARDASGGKRLLPAAASPARGGSSQRPRAALAATSGSRLCKQVFWFYSQWEHRKHLSYFAGPTTKTPTTSTCMFKTCSFPQPWAHLDPTRGSLCGGPVGDRWQHSDWRAHDTRLLQFSFPAVSGRAPAQCSDLCSSIGAIDLRAVGEFHSQGIQECLAFYIKAKILGKRLKSTKRP